jgi:hypothetical protein
MYIATRDSDER